MAISLKHKFTSPKADGPDTTIVRPSNWNDEHNITLAGERLLGRSASTAGSAEEISVANGISLSGGVLQLAGSPALTALTLSSSSTGVLPALRLANENSTGTGSGAAIQWMHAGVVKASIEANTYGSDYMAFRVGSNAEQLRISGSGGFGFGTNSPVAKLDAVAPNSVGLRLATSNLPASSTRGAYANFWQSGSEYVYDLWNFEPGIVRFGTNGSERGRFNNSGVFLVNTTSPVGSEMMRVNGEIRSSYLTIDGATSGAEGGELSLMGAPGYSVKVLDNLAGDLRIFSGFSTFTVQIFSFGSGSGNLSVQGSVSKGSGSFKIDHPLPELNETHHLVHSFIEGPQADNLYRGRVQLVNGAAAVNIDAAAGMTEGTFVLLNREVQCFTTNETDWDAVRGRVEGNILFIDSENPHCDATISWMVIGERQDKHMLDTEWTDDNGKVIVEPLKPPPQPIREEVVAAAQPSI